MRTEYLSLVFVNKSKLEIIRVICDICVTKPENMI